MTLNYFAVKEKRWKKDIGMAKPMCWVDFTRIKMRHSLAHGKSIYKY